MKELKIAKDVIMNLLDNNMNPEDADDLIEIKKGNNKILLKRIEIMLKIFSSAIRSIENPMYYEYLKTLISIFSSAKVQLEKGDDNE